MRNLKNLTPEQCVDIAKIIDPTVEWSFKKYEDWEGYDVIGKVDDEYYGTVTICVQLEYEQPATRNQIRLYINAAECFIYDSIFREIEKCLDSIGIN